MCVWFAPIEAEQQVERIDETTDGQMMIVMLGLARKMGQKQPDFRAAGFRITTNQWIAGILTIGALLTAPIAMAADSSLLNLSVAPGAKGSHAKTVDAKIAINAPPSLVWQTITNYADIQKILPGYEKSKVLKSSGSTKVLDIAMRVSSLLPLYKYQVQAQENPAAYQLTLNRISGDFRTLKATYQLIPQHEGKQTLLLYHLQIDPGISLPGSQTLIKNNTEKSLKALETHAEQEAKKSLIGQR